MIFYEKRTHSRATTLHKEKKNDDNQRTTGVRNANNINRNKTSVAAYIKLGVQI
jgi:hypothetical protein